MTTQDEEFLKRLRATFQVEAEEHLQAIASGLLELEKSPPLPQQQAVIETIYREAHSLKGAARAVNLTDIEAICQAVETVFAAWKRQPPVTAAETFDILHRAVDAIRAVLAPSEAGQSAAQQQCFEIIQRLRHLQSGGASSTHPSASAHAETDRSQTPETQPRMVALLRESDRAAVPETVRIAAAKLDARLLQSEEMLGVKLTMAHRAGELREMAGLFEQWHRAWVKASLQARAIQRWHEHPEKSRGESAVIPGELINFLDWNADYMRVLEGRLLSLAGQAEQDRQSVARLVNDLLEDSKGLLMLPFSTLADPFPKLVRDLARDQGKEVDLVLRGGEVEIDRRVLDEMKDAFIHILRNSVDHGVERPDKRALLNKPRRAVITIGVSHLNGDKVEILVSDDGPGVDLQAVKESAIGHGVITEADARALSEEEALELIFASEVSTSQTITEISGRGLGMAIVVSKVEKLGGQVSVDSRRNAGTTLRIVLPLTLARFRGIIVRVADRIFVIPTMNMERVLRVNPAEIKTVENRETVSLQNRAVSLARLDVVLEMPQKPNPGDDSKPVPIVVIRSAERRIAFAVDEILHEEEVLVKPLKKPLARVRNIAAATVLGSGEVIPVLNVEDLMKSASHARAAAKRPAADNSDKAHRRKLLVVEDSITSRMLLKNILESAGYEVKTAVDGVDAFTTLCAEKFDVVVSDVEMPRLNGFDLTSRIRADKRMADLPIVLVTSLESREERERGMDAGANAYIIKSNFAQSNLLDALSRLV